ncbi:hypothetical protein [Roseomonas sp. WA12]
MPKNDDPTEIEPRPAPVAQAPTGTFAQLKRDHESGTAGDKVPMLDPGLSPLGTDDEASGDSPDPQLIAEVRERESRDAPPPLIAADRQIPNPGVPRTVAIGLGVVGLLLLAGLLFWRMAA